MIDIGISVPEIPCCQCVVFCVDKFGLTSKMRIYRGGHHMKRELARASKQDVLRLSTLKVITL